MADGGTSQRAASIEQGLLAPCCWVQTLDVHESALASGLRHEIARRVSAGESSAGIERDLVARYGGRIVAVPETSLLPWVAPVVMTLLAMVAVMLVVKGRRWVRARETSENPRPALAREQAPEYDAQLERELQALAN